MPIINISMADSTKVVCPYLVKIELIIQTYCLYNHLCQDLLLRFIRFLNKRRKEVFPIHVSAQWYCVHALNVHRVL